MAKQKECPFCSGKYDDMLAACPYCGTINYKGAEAEYLNKLENVRTDMENLGSLPEQAVKKEVKKLKKLFIIIGIILVVLAAVFAGLYFLAYYEPPRDLQADYQWRQANYPIMDELYEQGAYDELREMYRTAWEEDRPLYEWEHDDFCSILDDAYFMKEILEQVEAGEELSDYYYKELVYYGWKFQGPYIKEHMDADEIERIKPFVEEYLEDFQSRWEFTEEEKAEFTEYMDENYGYPDFDLCEDYVKKWKKENRKK